MSPPIVPSVSSSFKIPAFLGETVFGAGAVTAASIPRKLLLVGQKGGGGTGTLTADTDIVQIFDQDTVDTKTEAGSELARMVRAALRVPNIAIYIAAPGAPSGSPVAATATITITGTPTTSGTLKYWICGDPIEVNASTSDTPTTIGDLIEDAVNQRAFMAVTAANTTGEVVLTAKTKSARTNDYIVFQDTTLKPAGITSALTGGAAVTGDGDTGSGVRFTGGTGTEDVTTLIATIKGVEQFDYVAVAQIDATNLARWEAMSDELAGPTIGKLTHILCASTAAALSTAQSLAQTTLNYPRAQLLWAIDEESPGPEVAAVMAAERTLAEQDNWAKDYDGMVLKGIAPQRNKSKRLSIATQTAALDSGVTPINTTDEGAVVVRSITTRSKAASGSPDYSTLDTHEAIVPDRVREDLKLLWTNSFAKANRGVRPDPAEEEPIPPPGVAYPRLWNQEITSRLLQHQASGFITGVETHLPFTTYNKTARWLESVVPVIPVPINHTAKVSVRQASL